MNYRKKMKADGSRLIPRKRTETLVLLSVLSWHYTPDNEATAKLTFTYHIGFWN